MGKLCCCKVLDQFNHIRDIDSIRADYAEEYVLKRIDEVVTHSKVLKKLVDKVNTHKK